MHSKYFLTGTPILKEKEIKEKVKELSETIREDYKDKELVLIGNLKGGFIFLADLYREIGEIKIEVDFVQTISYRNDIDIGSRIIIKRGVHDLDVSIKNKHVILVDDIIDTGRTMSLLKRTFLGKDIGAKSVKTCLFINKHERREKKLVPDYYGVILLEGFVVGYGLGFGDKYRCLKSIYVLEEE